MGLEESMPKIAPERELYEKFKREWQELSREEFERCLIPPQFWNLHRDGIYIYYSEIEPKIRAKSRKSICPLCRKKR